MSLQAQSIGFSPSLHLGANEMTSRRLGGGSSSVGFGSTTSGTYGSSANSAGEKELEKAVETNMRSFVESKPFPWLVWQQFVQENLTVCQDSGSAGGTAGKNHHQDPNNMTQQEQQQDSIVLDLTQMIIAGQEGASQMILAVSANSQLELQTVEHEQQKREWRAAQQHRTKTLHFLLLLNLNNGMDPPDYIRIEPYAKLQCWCDPAVAQAKMVQGSEAIGEALEAQYKSVQKEGVYKRVMEAHLEDARAAMTSTRRKAKDGRLLLHYNGHGTPKATSQGELWFFNRDHTHYLPMPVKDLVAHCGSPSLYVLDCNGAGGVLNAWKALMTPEQLSQSKDIWLCACSENGYLPSNPKLPADLLTSCLTTPVRIALVWYIYYSHRNLLLPDVTPDMVRNVPGDLTNRKTMLGEIHWILTAVTDTIAWSVLPNLQFYSVFRTDPIVVKTLFRNFLLADKILRELDCTPVSHPPLPADTHLHPMWSTWEVTLESLLCQLPSILDPATLKPKPNAEYKPTNFFTDQLTSFEVWLDVGNTSLRPQQLPCLVLGLIQTSYRTRSLMLLSRYLDVPQKDIAVNHSLYCGAIPYLSKLVSPNYPEVSLLLVVVWMQLMTSDADYSCAELIRAQAGRPFLKLLQYTPKSVSLVTISSSSSSGLPPDQQMTNPSTGSEIAPPQKLPSGSFNVGSVGMGTSLTMDGPILGTTLLQGSTTAAVMGGSNTDMPAPSGGGNSPQAKDKPSADGASSSQQRFYVMEGFTLHRYRAVTAYLMVELLERGGEQTQTWMWNNNLINISFQLLADPNGDFSEDSTGSSSSPGISGGGGASTTTAGGSSSNQQLGSVGAGSSLGNVLSANTPAGGGSLAMSPSLPASLPSAPGASAAATAAATAHRIAAATETEVRDIKLLQTWACLLQAKLLSCLNGGKQHAAMNLFSSKQRMFETLLQDRSPSLRSAAVVLLSSYIGMRVDLLPDKETALKRVDIDTRILKLLISVHNDPSSEVRREVMLAICQLLYWYATPTKTDLDEETILKLVGIDPTNATEEANSGGVDDSPSPSGKKQPQVPASGPDGNFGFTIPQVDRGVQTNLRSGPLGESGDNGEGDARNNPYLTKNDPLPSPVLSAWNMQSPVMSTESTPNVPSALSSLVRDACVVIGRFLIHHDAALAQQTRDCLGLIQHRQQPLSQRLALEAKRSMSGLCLTDYVKSEEESSKERMNVNLMRQTVLSTLHRQFTPASAAPSPSGSGATTSTGGSPATTTPRNKVAPRTRTRIVAVPKNSTPTTATVSSSTSGGGSGGLDLGGTGGGGEGNVETVPYTIHGLPLSVAEQVTAAKFRGLEHQVVHGGNRGLVSVSNIHAMDCITLEDSFVHEGGGVIQELHLVNDFAVNPLVCCCDVWGTFSLYNLYPDGGPNGSGVDGSVSNGLSGRDLGNSLDTTNFIGGSKKRKGFSPRAPLLTLPYQSVISPLDASQNHSRPLRVVSDYRPRDSSLFFSPSSNKLAWVSLEHQQLFAPVESLFQGAVITSIYTEKQQHGVGSSPASTIGPRVFAGTSDGIVVGLDDRSGKLSKAMDLDTRSSSPAAASFRSNGRSGTGSGGNSTTIHRDSTVISIGSIKDGCLHVATSTTMRVFDLRSTRKQVQEFDFASTAAGGTSGQQEPPSSASPPSTAAAVAIGRSVPMWCAVGQDGVVDMFTPGNKTLFPTSAPSGATSAPTSPAPGTSEGAAAVGDGLPTWTKPRVSVYGPDNICSMHPTKPMVLTGTQVVVYQGN